MGKSIGCPLNLRVFGPLLQSKISVPFGPEISIARFLSGDVQPILAVSVLLLGNLAVSRILSADSRVAKVSIGLPNK